MVVQVPQVQFDRAKIVAPELRPINLGNALAFAGGLDKLQTNAQARKDDAALQETLQETKGDIFSADKDKAEAALNKLATTKGGQELALGLQTVVDTRDAKAIKTADRRLKKNALFVASLVDLPEKEARRKLKEESLTRLNAGQKDSAQELMGLASNPDFQVVQGEFQATLTEAADGSEFLQSFLTRNREAGKKGKFQKSTVTFTNGGSDKISETGHREVKDGTGKLLVGPAREKFLQESQAIERDQDVDQAQRTEAAKIRANEQSEQGLEDRRARVDARDTRIEANGSNIGNIDDLLKGDLKLIFGRGEQLFTTLGSDDLRKQEGIDLQAKRDQLVGLLQLEQAKQARGQGTLSDAERDILKQAATLLGNNSISPKAAKAELNRIKGKLQKTLDKLGQRKSDDNARQHAKFAQIETGLTREEWIALPKEQRQGILSRMKIEAGGT